MPRFWNVKGLKIYLEFCKRYLPIFPHLLFIQDFIYASVDIQIFVLNCRWKFNITLQFFPQIVPLFANRSLLFWLSQVFIWYKHHFSSSVCSFNWLFLTLFFFFALQGAVSCSYIFLSWVLKQAISLRTLFSIGK